MPLLLPRKREELPRELFERHGALDELVTIATDAIEKGSFGAMRTVTVTRDQIHRLCPDYQPSDGCNGFVLCSSGELNGQPRRSSCSKCIAGQFSVSGLFVGELIPTTVLSPAL